MGRGAMLEDRADARLVREWASIISVIRCATQRFASEARLPGATVILDCAMES